MAVSTQQVTALDAAYRQQQVANQAATALAVVRLWASVRHDFLTIDAPIWLDRAAPIVLRGFERSARIGESYYSTLRHLRAPDAKPFVMSRIEPPPLAQIRTSLWVTGVVGAQERMNKLTRLPSVPDRSPSVTIDLSSFLTRQQNVMRAGTEAAIREAMNTSGAAAGAAAVRHAGNGGRTQVKEAAKADVRAKGYVRITSGKPCYFCAALASRGGVYESESFDMSDPRFEGPGTAKVHDSCVCTLRALFSENPAEVPELNQHFTKMWGQRGDGDPMLAFRQLYENRERAA